MVACVIGIKAITNIPYALLNVFPELMKNYNYLTFVNFALVLSHGLNLFVYLTFIHEFRKFFFSIFYRNKLILNLYKVKLFNLLNCV